MSGQKLIQCFSLNKSEIVFVFSDDVNSFSIKSWFGEISLFSFPDTEPKTGRNTKNLFEEIIGTKVSECLIHPHDRSFRINFEKEFSLVFMMYGKNGNILIFNKNVQVEKFRLQFEKHKNILLSDFDAYTNPQFEEYTLLSKEKGAINAIKDLFAGLSPVMIQYLEAHEIAMKPIPDQWIRIKNLETILLSGPIDIIQPASAGNEQVILTLLPVEYAGNKTFTTYDVIEAVNEFANRYFYEKHFRELQTSALASINAAIDKAKKQLNSARQTVLSLASDNNYKQLADIIMANLHTIPSGAESIKLFNFYTKADVEIKLKREMSPQHWAEKLYRKSKNQELEQKKTSEKIKTLESEIINLEKEMTQISAIENFKELKLVSKAGEKELKNNPVLPYRHFNYDGFDIYVGKSAANNDKLTFGLAHKEDLWLHAQGVSGSHVIIRNKQRTIFPQPVIEKAAKLAAYYSKNKGSILSPVIYTLCKYVRKPKGAAPGAVICEKEKMIMAAPGLV